ncbi:unnamed protein product [Ixodes persulcatus]
MLCATRSSRSKSATGHTMAPLSNCQALTIEEAMAGGIPMRCPAVLSVTHQNFVIDRHDEYLGTSGASNYS